MARMMSAPGNRGVLHVDDPWDDDGFYEYRRFKATRKGGGASGKRAWRREIRTKEARRWKREEETSSE